MNIKVQCLSFNLIPSWLSSIKNCWRYDWLSKSSCYSWCIGGCHRNGSIIHSQGAFIHGNKNSFYSSGIEGYFETNKTVSLWETLVWKLIFNVLCTEKVENIDGKWRFDEYAWICKLDNLHITNEY